MVLGCHGFAVQADFLLTEQVVRILAVVPTGKNSGHNLTQPMQKPNGQTVSQVQALTKLKPPLVAKKKTRFRHVWQTLANHTHT